MSGRGRISNPGRSRSMATDTSWNRLRFDKTGGCKEPSRRGTAMLQARGHRATSGASESRERIGGVVLMEPKQMQGLTIGEVSRMLGMSLSMVERLFDEGILAGWKHPTTGMIVIDLGSIRAFRRKQNGTQ